jgi:transcriptional regulator with XRE-family HTH domain
MSITAKRIKQLRKMYGWTQKELADKINSSRTNIARIETDKVHTSYPMLSTIANTFEVPVEYLQGVVNANIDDNHDDVLYFYDDGEQLDPDVSFNAHNMDYASQLTENQLHIASHIDDTLTLEQLNEIRDFIEYLKQKHKD